MTTGRNTPWSSRVRRDLRCMWQHGLTARQIADALNARHGLALTRNAVIGKLNRLGLMGQRRKSRPGAAYLRRRREAPSVRRQQRGPTPRPAPRKAPPAPAARQSPMKATPPAPAPAPARKQPVPVSTRRGISDIMQLKPGMCRWVDGDRGAWVWCGAPTDGGSWCEKHRAIVFGKAKEEKQPCRA